MWTFELDLILPNEDFSQIAVGEPNSSEAFGTYNSESGTIAVAGDVYGGLHRFDKMGIVGILSHEVMHKILHRLEGIRACGDYDNIYWSMRLDQDYQDGKSKPLNTHSAIEG